MRLRSSTDEGAALISVVILGFVMMMLVATGLTVATSGRSQAVGVQRSSSALDAAYAGVQDYVARLNVDSNYYLQGNPESTFNTSTTKKVEWADPWNKAFGLGEPNGSATHDARATWATVKDSDKSTSDTPSQYRYAADLSKFDSAGIIRLQSTGRAGNRTRTIVATLRVKGFTDFGYFTDLEIKDPETWVNPPAVKTFDPKTCAVYAWQGRPKACSYRDTNTDPATTKTTDMRVQFQKSDVLYGDVHTNDTPVLACGMTVEGTFETGAPTTDPMFTTAKNCSPKIPLVHADTVSMPATNSSMRSDATCLYTGPTQITYNGPAHTVTVVSPWSRNPGPAASCGAAADLRQPQGATFSQAKFNGQLVYVQNVRTPAEDPANGWTSTTRPSTLTCIGPGGDPDASAYNGIGWSVGSGASQIRYPLAGEAPATSWMTTSTPAQWSTGAPAYGCRNGDLYISGQLSGGSAGASIQTTAASENYVWVTNDLTYENKSADLLGLVGQSSVVVWNPMSLASDQPMVKPGHTGIQVNFEIDAAIISVLHTFRVQNYNRGATRGALVVFGSIAQKFRGTVAGGYNVQNADGTYTTVNTGYSKAYQYDTVLKTISPPKFLNPTDSNYTVIGYATVNPSGGGTP
ncbi:hypothetical protein [Amnibacterium setariae]|uniref:Type 4 fimbrial biogenesis protein PilX N-terminal domain-containing protein n=1 Tax=Amnibacterium setariae TaxID=2306585 RepID=A0A3A1U1U4_9MICO|nr:hypothetical protein [Amnibacterium setariae]RIX30310.1 hypothetical protein D1781_02415 [Amnibacterium setariae]